MSDDELTETERPGIVDTIKAAVGFGADQPDPEPADESAEPDAAEQGLDVPEPDELPALTRKQEAGRVAGKNYGDKVARKRAANSKKAE